MHVKMTNTFPVGLLSPLSFDVSVTTPHLTGLVQFNARMDDEMTGRYSFQLDGYDFIEEEVFDDNMWDYLTSAPMITGYRADERLVIHFIRSSAPYDQKVRLWDSTHKIEFAKSKTGGATALVK